MAPPQDGVKVADMRGVNDVNGTAVVAVTKGSGHASGVNYSKLIFADGRNERFSYRRIRAALMAGRKMS